MHTIAQVPENKYCNYFHYALQLCGDGPELRAECIYAPVGRIAKDLTVIFQKVENTYRFVDFKISLLNMNDFGMQTIVR